MSGTEEMLIIAAAVSIAVSTVLKILLRIKLKRMEGIGPATLIKGNQTEKTILRGKEYRDGGCAAREFWNRESGQKDN